jgi:hypothetical protein
MHGKISLWHYANSMPENCNYLAVVIGSLPYKISGVSVKQHMGYMEKSVYGLT